MRLSESYRFGVELSIKNSARMNITIFEIYRNISLAQCINLIVQNNTKNNDLISVYSDYNRFQFPHKQMDYSKKVLSHFKPTKPNFYIFENLEDYKLRNFYKGLRRRNVTFNARANYIFVGEDFNENFLRITAKNYLLNALFINSVSGTVSTYFPFKTNSINNMITGLVNIAVCRDGTIQFFGNYTELYPNKIPRKWRNSTIRVMHHHHKVYSMCGKCDEQGIEIEIFDTISKRVGVKAIFYRVDTPPMAWRLFHEGVFDLFLINFIPIQFTDFTMSYIREIYYWFVPFPDITPRWMNILTIFPMDVWIAWISSAVLITAVWTISSYFFGKKLITQLLRIVGFILSLFLEQSRKVILPKWIHEFLVLKALFLAFFMNTFFKCRLTYLLNGLNYEVAISSFEEAVQKGMIIGTIKDYVPMFNTSAEIANYLEHKLVLCHFDSLECANRTAFVKDMVSMQSGTKVIDAKPIFFDDKAGHWVLKALQPPLHIKPIVASFQLGFPMFHLYNTYLYRLVESGIVDKISRRYYNEKALNTKEPNFAATSSLNIDHVVAPGVLWVAGVFLSIFLFVLERKKMLDFIYRKRKVKDVNK